MRKAFVSLLLVVGTISAFLVAGGTASASTSLTTISASPLPFSSTNGDILAVTKILGVSPPRIAIGGNFTAVITPDGVSHPARNFAILDQATGKVLYGGVTNGYVRTISSFGGYTYIGGDFTLFGGHARYHVVSLGPTFAVTAFNPGSPGKVRVLSANAYGVVIGGDAAHVRKVALGTGKQIWTQPVAGGSVRALQWGPGGVLLYIGGLFNSYAGVARHGLVAVSAASGVLQTGFDAHLRANSGIGTYGAYDGESVLALTYNTARTGLVVGIGGHAPAGVTPSNQVRQIAPTGATVWKEVLPGDCQAVAPVGNTDFAGFHRNNPNGSVPYPNFAAQLDDANGNLVKWDPRLTGVQSNADSGNNGVQASYADPVAKVLYIGGAFTLYAGKKGHQSLIAFRYS